MSAPRHILNLMHWFSENKRDLPFRGSSDPWVIWLSEIIFQQTRIQQGLPYFERFISRFPNVESLAHASEDEVLKLWQGLGYYSRARNLMEGANQVAAMGKFPQKADEWIKIKGIGPYTAAAIASIAFHENVAVIDGNVKRVVSRFLAIAEPVDSKQFMNLAKTWLQVAMKNQKSGEFNQAMMELGALVCVPRNPKCFICPLQDYCLAFHQKKPEFFPQKKKSKTHVHRHFVFILAELDGKTWIRKRQGNDIWKALYEFPLFEIEEGQTEPILKFGLRGLEPFVIVNEHKTSHVLTHQKLKIEFLKILPKKVPQFEDSSIFEVRVEDLPQYAFPVAIAKVIPHFFNHTL